MKSQLIIALLIYTLAVVDATFMTGHVLRPSLLWPVVVLLVSRGRPRTALVWSMIAGLLVDCRHESLFGLHALLAVALGWTLIRTRRHWCRRGVIAPAIAVGGTVFVGQSVVLLAYHGGGSIESLLHDSLVQQWLIESLGQSAVTLLCTIVLMSTITGARLLFSSKPRGHTPWASSAS